MKELAQVLNYEGNEVRTTMKGEEVLFALSDVCAALDIQNPSQVASRINEKDIHLISSEGNKGSRELSFINEPALYKVIFQSRKPEAERFTDWVTRHVLPSIRKTGVYGVNEKQQAALEQLDMMVGIMEDYKKQFVHSQDQLNNLLESRNKIERQTKKLVSEMESKGTQLDWVLKAATTQINQTFEVFQSTTLALDTPSVPLQLSAPPDEVEQLKKINMTYKDALEAIARGHVEGVEGVKLDRDMLMEIANFALFEF